MARARSIIPARARARLELVGPLGLGIVGSLELGLSLLGLLGLGLVGGKILYKPRASGLGLGLSQHSRPTRLGLGLGLLCWVDSH